MVKIKNQVPNILTLANLICGTLIIIAGFQLQFATVAWLAALAIIFDFLDGTVARLLGVTSSVGKELDSMADMVSFGVAPALVLYNYWQNELFEGDITSLWDTSSWNNLLIYFPLLISAFAGYRLAKFNISEQAADYFQGLPTPALAVACFALPLAAEQHQWSNVMFTHPLFIIGFCLLGGILLVSDFKLFSLKLGSKNTRLNLWRLALVIVCIVLILWLHFVGAFLCLVVYLIFSILTQKIIA